MNAVAAFENRKDTLRAQLEESENMPQAISAATMTLEQIACDLAQDEQDDFARQRQQAVMALAKRLPTGAARKPRQGADCAGGDAGAAEPGSARGGRRGRCDARGAGGV